MLRWLWRLIVGERLPDVVKLDVVRPLKVDISVTINCKDGIRFVGSAADVSSHSVLPSEPPAQRQQAPTFNSSEANAKEIAEVILNGGITKGKDFVGNVDSVKKDTGVDSQLATLKNMGKR